MAKNVSIGNSRTKSVIVCTLFQLYIFAKMAAIPFIGHLSEGFIIFRETAHNIHTILQLSEYRLYIVTPLIAVLEDNSEDTTDVTTNVTTDVTTEVDTDVNTEINT